MQSSWYTAGGHSVTLLFPGVKCSTIRISPRPCVCRWSSPLLHVVSASVTNEVPWGWQIYSKTCRWWLSDTKANFQSPVTRFKL